MMNESWKTQRPATFNHRDGKAGIEWTGRRQRRAYALWEVTKLGLFSCRSFPSWASSGAKVYFKWSQGRAFPLSPLASHIQFAAGGAACFADREGAGSLQERKVSISHMAPVGTSCASGDGNGIAPGTSAAGRMPAALRESPRRGRGEAWGRGLVIKVLYIVQVGGGHRTEVLPR